MTSEALAAFRKTHGQELAKLAEEHLKHDLQESDREILQRAASRFSTHATIGSILGLGLGALLAFRVRSARMRMFTAFKTKEKPTHVQFADGRTEAIPDVTRLVQPTVFGDIAAYFFFTAGGLFVGGETGLLTGSFAAGRTIMKDPDARQRIETAFRKFRADALRREATRLDGGQSVFDKFL
ncbi:hypothetical protein EJ08DRAFT_696417 [Tothia fuscella]|uniref:Uncharacterized protein n=1 Tax=Tothia fuscella TaxID=1048955 RepID=A0A9P4NTG9_9PEZI|nr:hypothetical protein EJ08DRAFT_696417 [Tothia fuscella]